MFSRTETLPTAVPQTLSLEFEWKANSAYWAGEIQVIDLYIDGQLRYTINIPKSDEAEPKTVSLPFKKNERGSSSEVDYLIIKNLDTTKKMTLKAGIFNEKQGNTLTRNFNGTWSRDIRLTRENLPIDLDLSSVQLGKHYKIIATHAMKRTTPGGAYWQGDDLDTKVEESGPSKKNIPLPPRAAASSSFSDTSPAASLRPESLPVQFEFEYRRKYSENPQEIGFFTLALEHKYEEAIMLASNMDDQGLGGRLILELLEHRQELGIDVNTMNDNPLKQTPLHRVAINSKWHAYYALVERGANSRLADSRGKEANQYRTANGMTIFNQQAQHQIRKDLFGDAALEAEAYINAVNSMR